MSGVIAEVNYAQPDIIAKLNEMTNPGFVCCMTDCHIVTNHDHKEIVNRQKRRHHSVKKETRAERARRIIATFKK